jgi:hypothetical protein
MILESKGDHHVEQRFDQVCSRHTSLALVLNDLPFAAF